MAKALGYQKAVKLLINEDISPRAAERLCQGTYESEPKAIKDKLQAVLVRHGFSTDEKAS